MTKKIGHAFWAGIVAVGLVGLQQPASANDSGESSPVEIASGSIVVPNSQVEQDLSDGDHPDNRIEASAVRGYLKGLPTDGTALEPEDVLVASVPITADLAATVVIPDGAGQLGGLKFSVDDDGISAGASVASASDEVATAGPGMGAWPKWVDSPSWVLELRLYVNNYKDLVGVADFQTQRRKYQGDGTSARDLWQIARRARATPQTISQPGADTQMYVEKLWISQQLTSASQGHAQAWRQDLTAPDEGFSKCSGGTSVAAGPFTFSPSNCEDYDVWQGAVGHQRFSYDQGAYAGGEQRAIAYVSGIQMDDGYPASATWYEFVTLRPGHYNAMGQDFKCTSEDVGMPNGTFTGKCTYSYDTNGN